MFVFLFLYTESQTSWSDLLTAECRVVLIKRATSRGVFTSPAYRWMLRSSHKRATNKRISTLPAHRWMLRRSHKRATNIRISTLPAYRRTLRRSHKRATNRGVSTLPCLRSHRHRSRWTLGRVQRPSHGYLRREVFGRLRYKQRTTGQARHGELRTGGPGVGKGVLWLYCADGRKEGKKEGLQGVPEASGSPVCVLSVRCTVLLEVGGTLERDV